MRKVLVVVLAAAVVAVAAGFALPADAIKMTGGDMSAGELNNELVAIDRSVPWQCYLQARAYVESGAQRDVPGLPGVKDGATWNNSFVAYWSSLRASQLAQVDYVRANEPAAFSDAAMAVARRSLAKQIYDTNAEAVTGQINPASPFSCPGLQTGAATLSPQSVPPWFANEQVEAQAAYLGLAPLADGYVKEDPAALEEFFNSHKGKFAGLCVSLIFPGSPAAAATVEHALRTGMSFVEAAKKYSQDPSTGPKGGFFGCQSPGDQYYDAISVALGTLRPGAWRYVTLQSGQSFFIRFDEVQPRTYEQVKGAVAKYVRSQNGAAASLLAVKVLRDAGVTVDPAVGVWVDTPLGGRVDQPPAPKGAVTENPTANDPPISEFSPQSTGLTSP